MDASADYERDPEVQRRDRANAVDGGKGVRTRLDQFRGEYAHLLTSEEIAVLWSAGETLRGIERRLGQ